METISLTKAGKRILGFTFCCLIFLLTGCWDRVEVNDLALVVATGIDINEDNQIELSVQIINPRLIGTGQSGAQSSDSSSTIVETASGKTIFDAMSILQEKVSRRIFMGHNRVIVIGKKLAKQGIQNHFDFFARYPVPRLRAFIFVTNGPAVNALKVLPDIERSSAEMAKELANFRIGMSVTAQELLKMLSSETDAAAIPWITAEKKSDVLKLDGTAIFKNGKMIGKINDQITRGLLWLRDEIELSSVTLVPEGSKGQISFNLLRSNTELIPKIENGVWKMIVKIVAEDDAVENESKLNLMNPGIVKSLEKQLAQRINTRISIALEKIQKDLKADILGFGEEFHREFPKEWSKEKERWDEKFPEIEVEIKTRAYIRRPGMSTTPQGVHEDEVIGK